MVRRRVPMQVSPEFMQKLKELRIKSYANGKEINLIQLTEKIADPIVFTKIEQAILKDDINEILRFDRRKKR